MWNHGSTWKLSKKNWCLYLTGLFFLVFLAAIYYFGILRGFTPNSEDLSSLSVAYENRVHSEGMSRNIWILLLEIAVSKYGYSYKSIRLVWTSLYFAICLLTLDLVLRDEKNEINISRIPIFFLFMVLMHKSSSVYYGVVTDQVYQYPFNYHMFSTLFSLLCIWIIREEERNQKKWLWVIVLFAIILGLMDADGLFLITFLAPLFLTCLCRWIKTQKTLVFNIILGLLLIEILKISSAFIPFLGKLFIGSSTLYSGDVAYGISNYKDIVGLKDNIFIFVGALSGLFNWDISGMSMQNLTLVMYLIRIVCTFFIVYIVCRQVKYIIPEARDGKWCKNIICIGFLLLCISFIFTENGSEQCHVRYLPCLIPYGTIILCWEYDKLAELLHLELLKKPYVKCSIFTLCCLLSFSWKEWLQPKEVDGWDNAYYKINEIVEEKGLHEGLGSLWTAGNVSAVENGKHIVDIAQFDFSHNRLERQIDLKNNDYFYDYVLVGDIHWNSMYTSVEQMTEIYGEPDEIIEIEHYSILIYRKGLNLAYRSDVFVMGE